MNEVLNVSGIKRPKTPTFGLPLYVVDLYWRVILPAFERNERKGIRWNDIERCESPAGLYLTIAKYVEYKCSCSSPPRGKMLQNLKDALRFCLTGYGVYSPPPKGSGGGTLGVLHYETICNIIFSKDTVDMLEVSGLIVQKKDPDDKRRYLVYPQLMRA